MITLDLETILVIVIAIITIQLIVVGVYIIMLLRDTKRTVNKAEKVIDDINVSVKDGIDKATAMQAPLAALATTTNAINSMMKGATSLKDMTKTVMGASRIIKPSGKSNDIPVDVKGGGDNQANQNVQAPQPQQNYSVNNTQGFGSNPTVTATVQTVGAVAGAVGSVANVFANRSTKHTQAVNGVGDNTTVGESSEQKPTTNEKKESGASDNDYSVGDWTKENGDSKDNPKDEKSEVTSLADTITTVTPPNVETKQDDNDKKKKKRRGRPRFFRRK